MKKLWQWINCNVFKMHDWTCKHNEGIPPTETELNNGAAGFFHYARMYCKHCGHQYEGNLYRHE